MWRVARQIRIDRRVAQDEVVRVTLHDKDGAVLFEGEVRQRSTSQRTPPRTRAPGGARVNREAGKDVEVG